MKKGICGHVPFQQPILNTQPRIIYANLCIKNAFSRLLVLSEPIFNKEKAAHRRAVSALLKLREIQHRAPDSPIVAHDLIDDKGRRELYCALSRAGALCRRICNGAYLDAKLGLSSALFIINNLRVLPHVAQSNPSLPSNLLPRAPCTGLEISSMVDSLVRVLAAKGSDKDLSSLMEEYSSQHFADIFAAEISRRASAGQIKDIRHIQVAAELCKDKETAHRLLAHLTPHLPAKTFARIHQAIMKRFPERHAARSFNPSQSTPQSSSAQKLQDAGAESA